MSVLLVHNACNSKIYGPKEMLMMYGALAGCKLEIRGIFPPIIMRQDDAYYTSDAGGAAACDADGNHLKAARARLAHAGPSHPSRAQHCHCGIRRSHLEQ